MQEENENAPTATAAAPEQTAESAGNAATTESAAAGETTQPATTEEAITTEEPAPATASEPEDEEDITYQAVQKDGHVTAIWEMQGRKHLRTIDPRAREGQEILRLFTAEDHEHPEEEAAA